jgi:hypothetical protein
VSAHLDRLPGVKARTDEIGDAVLEKFPSLDAAKADYVKRGYVELPVMGSAEI